MYLGSLTSTVGITENVIPIILGRRAVDMQEPSAWVFSAMELPLLSVLFSLHHVSSFAYH
jgi:hypothetical protein